MGDVFHFVSSSPPTILNPLLEHFPSKKSINFFLFLLGSPPVISTVVSGAFLGIAGVIELSMETLQEALGEDDCEPNEVTFF